MPIPARFAPISQWRHSGREPVKRSPARISRCRNCSRPRSTRDMLLLGWAGKDWVDSENLAGFGPCHRRAPQLRWRFYSIPDDYPGKTDPGTPGPPCRSIREWSGLSAGFLAQPGFLWRRPAATDRIRDLDHRAERRYRRGGLVAPAGPSRHLGLRHQRRADADRHSQGRRNHPGAGRDQQDGHGLRAEPLRPESRFSPSRNAPIRPAMSRANRPRPRSPIRCCPCR